MNFRPVINNEESRSIRAIPALAIDLGFAEKSASCGLSNRDGGLRFSDAVRESASWLSSQHKEAVLILEAPLSGAFDEKGNPCARGRFETHHSNTNESSNRRWQSGAGASMALAALHFLRLLQEKVTQTDLVAHVVEGFCSRYGNELKKPSHTAVARELIRLWQEVKMPLVEIEGKTKLSTLSILDPRSLEFPPAILRVEDSWPSRQ